MANGTDCPVESINPFECIYASITRKRLDSGMAFTPEQKMTRDEALKSYTIWNAFAAKEETIKGSITAGKLADIIVLDRNLLECKEEDIPKTKVVHMFLDGKQLY